MANSVDEPAVMVGVVVPESERSPGGLVFGVRVKQPGTFWAVAVYVDVCAARLNREVYWHLHEWKRKRRAVERYGRDRDLGDHFAFCVGDDHACGEVQF